MVEAMGGGLIQWLYLAKVSKLANILYSRVEGITWILYILYISMACSYTLIVRSFELLVKQP